eukprot:19426-Heterococcus_DN1.PRE.1
MQCTRPRVCSSIVVKPGMHSPPVCASCIIARKRSGSATDNTAVLLRTAATSLRGQQASARRRRAA